MTSKEALSDLVAMATLTLNKDVAKRLAVIAKDLYLLEILRKYVYFSVQSGCVRMKDVYKRTTNFDYEDLREWLEK